MKFIALFVFLISSCCEVVLAQTWQASPNSNNIEFKAIGIPGFLTIDSKGGIIEGELIEKDSMISGKLKVKLADIKTGLKLKDDHMLNKYFEIEKFPYVVLELKNHPKMHKNFKGMLTIKKDTKPIQGNVDVKCSDASCVIKGDFVVNILEFPSFGKPNYEGVGVDEKVKVKFDFIAAKKK